MGESGCGKSLTALSIMRLLPQPPARTVAGVVVLGGRDILVLGERAMRRVRGREISMIFQDPIGSLNPVATVRAQLLEVLQAHTALRGAAAEARILELLRLVGIPDPEARRHDFPHRLSGGMSQRVMIAMAIACDPAVLLADEPTTALDVTVQAQVLRVLADIQARTGMAILLITHDLGVVAEAADRVAVMYAGHKVEEAPVQALFDAPLHPYTRGLLAATPVRGAAVLHEIPGQVPTLDALPAGCPYAPRCPLVMPVCVERMPALTTPDPAHQVACFATGGGDA